MCKLDSAESAVRHVGYLNPATGVYEPWCVCPCTECLSIELGCICTDCVCKISEENREKDGKTEAGLSK